MIQVQNLCSPRTGRPVANQFKITANNGVKYFQSYETIIARVDKTNVIISKDWNYSQTTTKYLCEFLDDCGWCDMNTAEIRKYLTAKIFKQRAVLRLA